MTAQHHNAYIDEAGDEGFTTPEIPHVGSSEWLVLAAVIVAEEDDLALSQAIDTLRHPLRYQPVEATRKLAQVADFYASATAAALEPDQYGMPTEDYLMRVKHSSIASQARASRATASRCSQTSIRPAIRAVASL